MPKRLTTVARPEAEETSVYLRSKTPVRVRQGFRDWRRLPLRWIFLSAALLGLGLATTYSLVDYLRSDPRFRFAGDRSGLRISGLRYVTPETVQKVFQPDSDASVFETPLEERRRQLLRIPWVREAAVLRIWPNRLWVRVEERRPVAFVRVSQRNQPGRTPMMIDSQGVFLEPPAGKKFTLPVVTGIVESMALADRRRRIALLEALVEDLDSARPRYSPMISEVDISDAQNAQLTTVQEGDVIDLQMGNEHFRHRFEVFLKYIQSWKNEFGTVSSVDLRFKGHVAIRQQQETRSEEQKEGTLGLRKTNKTEGGD